jgi:hypothetical protein
MVIEKLHNNFFSVDDGIRYPHVDQGYIYIYIYIYIFFFIYLFFFCDVATIGDCPQEEIAKFG